MSAKKLRADVISVNKEKHAFAAKYKELVLKVQCMPGLDDEAMVLSARVAEQEESFKMKSPKVRDKQRIADREVAAKQAVVELTEHTAHIEQLEGDFYGLKCKLELLKRCNDISDSQYPVLVHACMSLKPLLASGKVCSGEMVQHFANALKDVNASLDDLNLVPHAQKAVQDTFCTRLVTIAKRFQTYFQQKISILSKSVDEAARKAV